jgi:hypothetical protein
MFGDAAEDVTQIDASVLLVKTLGSGWNGSPCL